MKRLLFSALLCAVMFYAHASYAISVGGSISGSGFGVGVSSDGSATVRGGKGPASGSARIEADKKSSQPSSSSASSSSSSTTQAAKPIFEISPSELPKYKGKTPKVYARANGALIYADTIYLYYNKENKLIEIKVIDPDGSVRHSAMRHADMRIKMPKGYCEMQGEDFICPK